MNSSCPAALFAGYGALEPQDTSLDLSLLLKSRDNVTPGPVLNLSMKSSCPSSSPSSSMENTVPIDCSSPGPYPFLPFLLLHSFLILPLTFSESKNKASLIFKHRLPPPSFWEDGLSTASAQRRAITHLVINVIPQLLHSHSIWSSPKQLW